MKDSKSSKLYFSRLFLKRDPLLHFGLAFSLSICGFAVLIADAALKDYGVKEYIYITKDLPFTTPDVPKIVVTITRALYQAVDGVHGSKDVTAQVAGMVTNYGLTVAANNTNFGDPAPNYAKELVVNYTLNGTPLTKTALEGQVLSIGDTAMYDIVGELPYNAQFQPRLEVDAPAGKVISLNSTDPTVICQQPVQRYTTSAGIQTFEAPGWINGQGAIYTIPSGVTVRSLTYHETGYDTKFTGSFWCNDSDYTLLWQRATRTCYVCMRDHFMDAPDRERNEWVGDAVNEMSDCYYAFDTSALQLCRNLINSRQLNGLPGQELLFYGEYGVWLYYLYSGDLATLTSNYSFMKAYLDKYTIDASGLPAHIPESFDWYDWGPTGTDDKKILQVAEYYMALKALKKIAKVTGHSADTVAINTKCASIENNFNRVFWTTGGYKTSDVPVPDERANAIAVIAGLADKTKWNTIFNVIQARENAGCFFDRWISEALCMMGKQEHALLRMYRRYAPEIQGNVTTLWEHYAMIREAGDFLPTVSMNHGWNAPNFILSKSIAGLAPEAPGWSTYHVFPQEAFLTSINVGVSTARGPISVTLRKTGTKYTIQLTSPLATTAIVGMPKSSFTSITAVAVNGTTVWNGSYTGGVSGVSWNGEDSLFVKFNVTAGTWTFEGTGTLPVSSPKLPNLSIPPHDDSALYKKSWSVSASVDNKYYPVDQAVISAASVNVLDRDSWTCWRSIGQTQTPGQWFRVDMKQQQTFHKIVLDNAWAVLDYPKSYAVYATNDTANWGTAIATGPGQFRMTTIVFPEKTARYLKITQTGTKDSCWSITELDVFTKSGGTTRAAGPHPAIAPPLRNAESIIRIAGNRLVLPDRITGTAFAVTFFDLTGKYVRQVVIHKRSLDLNRDLQMAKVVYLAKVRVLPYAK
jgi:hypothetical protein